MFVSRFLSTTLAFAALALLPSSSSLYAQEFVRIEASRVPIQDGITGLVLPVRTDAFWIGRTELSQREYVRVMGQNPSRYRGETRPVENVSWRDAVAYCNRRSRNEGLAPCYDDQLQIRRDCDGYRLPTENEWLRATGAAADGALPEDILADSALYDGENSVAAILERAKVGTRDTMEEPANSDGIKDLVGNVWEWCADRFNAVRIIDSVHNPGGPQIGNERVIRGGSFLNRAREWNKGFRSSMLPEAKSEYVGFRLARSIQAKPVESDSSTMPSIKAITASEAPVVPDRSALRKRWLNVLGQPSLPPGPVKSRVVDRLEEPAWTGRLLELTVEEGFPWRALMVLPTHRKAEKLPVVIVPYYDVDTPAGKNLGGRNSLPPGVRAFAHVAAQYGMAALVVRWSGENDSPGYYEMVASLAERHPGVSGLGYWVWQAQQLTDWLGNQPEIDAQRIGIMGHSLGGKMALYAAAFENLIRAVVSSEPGIAFSFTNYQDPWYYGERISLLPPGTDQDELLALTAPRPFLLIAGESADGVKGIPLLQRAARAYAASGKPNSLFMLNHGTGHSPTPESVVEAFEWLRAQLAP